MSEGSGGVRAPEPGKKDFVADVAIGAEEPGDAGDDVVGIDNAESAFAEESVEPVVKVGVADAGLAEGVAAGELGGVGNFEF